MVMPLFTGLRPLLLGDDKPVGMPAVYKLMKHLRENGDEVEVAVVLDGLPGKKAIAEPEFDHASIQGINFHTLQLPYPKAFATLTKARIPTLKLAGALRMVHEYRELGRLTRLVRPDLIYANMTYGLVSGVIGKLHGIPVVLRSYGTELGNALSPFPEGGWRLALHEPVSVLTFRASFKYLIMTNDGTKGDLVAKRYGVPEKKLAFWLNGVDKNIFRQNFDRDGFLRKVDVPSGKRVVLTVSRLADWKRVDRIVRAAPIVVEEMRDVVFLIVGDGPELPRLQAMASSLGVEGYVRFTGAVSHEEIPDFMNAADLFVSLYDVSNLCNPVLEAMSCGKCVVTVDDGSLHGIIRDAENGVLLKPDAIERQLPETIIGLLRDGSRRSRLGSKALDHAQANFCTWEERMKKEIALLEQVVLYPKG